MFLNWGQIKSSTFNLYFYLFSFDILFNINKSVNISIYNIKKKINIDKIKYIELNFYYFKYVSLFNLMFNIINFINLTFLKYYLIFNDLS